MEKKRTQRIIGILVVLALVVIVLPLLFGKNDMPIQEAANVKAPPFPDQQTTDTVTTADAKSDAAILAPTATAKDGEITTASATTLASNTLTDTTTPKTDAALATEAKNTTNGATTAATPTQTVEAGSHTIDEHFNSDEQNNEASDTVDISSTIADTLNNRDAIDNVSVDNKATTVQTAAATTTETHDTSTKATTTDANNSAVATTTKATGDNLKAKPAIDLQKSSKNANSKAVLASNNAIADQLKNLKSPAWVVQMGSFKNKENAMRLADKLRAAGFKAFTREMKAPSGATTLRVFIGPEFKQASAVKLSNDIQQSMNLSGIVVSFKPLEI